jgi:hypothetical protein
MGCMSQAPRVVQFREATQEEKEKRQKEKAQYLEEALILLRKAGFPVDICTDTNRARIIADEWDISQIDGELKVLLEGYDISKHIGALQMMIGGENFPVTITSHMKPIVIGRKND